MRIKGIPRKRKTPRTKILHYAYPTLERGQCERILSELARRQELVKAGNNDCCGNGPHTPGTVRVMPAGGDSNLILCRACWQRELTYRRERNRELGDDFRFSLPAWETAKVYRTV
jgi:hypothetical protein